MSDFRDEAMTRSEEELVVDTVWRPAERVRVRKRIVEEDVTVTVRVRREELEIVREPVSHYDPPRRDAGERVDDLVIVLHEERPLVTTEVVPVERVRIHRYLLRAGHETIGDTVRREQIELERP